MNRFLEYVRTRSLGILAAGVLVGLLSPTIAQAARPALTPTVVLFLFATFVRVDTIKIASSFSSLRIAISFPTLVMLVSPVLLVVVARMVGLAPWLVAAIGLTALCPPSTGNAAVARSMGSDHSAALAIILICTAAAPLTVPFLADVLVSQRVPIEVLARNIGVMVGGTGAVALVAVRFAKPVVARSATALDVLAIVALVVFAIGAMDGVQQQIIDNPVRALFTTIVVYAVNGVLQAIGFAVGVGSVRDRLAFSMSVGNRNVGLIWAALGAAADAEISFYFALYQFPFFTLPLAFESVARLRVFVAQKAGK